MEPAKLTRTLMLFWGLIQLLSGKFSIFGYTCPRPNIGELFGITHQDRNPSLVVHLALVVRVQAALLVAQSAASDAPGSS